MAVPLPRSKETSLLSPLTHCLELRLSSGGKMWALPLRFMETQDTLLGAPVAQQPRGPRSWCGGLGGRTQQTGGASRLPGKRRGMHLVLRCLCAKQLLEQRGAVCLLSGGTFLSEPHWLLDVNGLFVEWLKCMKEIRWRGGVCFSSYYIMKDAFCKNRWPRPNSL